MPSILKSLVIFCWLIGAYGLSLAQTPGYPWISEYHAASAISRRVPLPTGFIRPARPPASAGEWLRRLPLKTAGAPVLLFNRTPKPNQTAHFAVIDLDVGHRDLQQCADLVIRLRAEYLYASNAHRLIAFNFTSGDRAHFSQWAAGYRPLVKENRVSWVKKAGIDYSYANFKRYLETVFMYAGSYSLSRELQPIKTESLEIGDIFIQGGFPGHAVIVVDVAEHTQTKERLFLLAQSYMPAQDAHVLNNPHERQYHPWYSVNFGATLKTPEWTFTADHLKRFKD